MKKQYFVNILATKTTKFFFGLFFFFSIFIGTNASAQVAVTVTGTGNVTLSSGSMQASYTSLLLAITDLNKATAFSGPVTLTCAASGTETAPVGGYSINFAANITTAANYIVLDGNNSTITAYSPQTASSINDAILKLNGTDYITIKNFVLQENASNTTTPTTTAVGTNTNNMTEFGIALFYKTSTDGCQFVTLENNTISLNRANSNSFGIYSNSNHAAATPATTFAATGTAGGNHDLTIIKNTISNVNVGMAIIGTTAIADMQQRLIIGGSAVNANTITNFGQTTTNMMSFANSSATINGILLRNCVGFNITHNSLTSSNGGVVVGNLNGIHIFGYSINPTATFTNNINNNSFLSMKSGLLAGVVNGILLPSSTASASTLNINDNSFTDFGHTGASPTGNVIFISNLYLANTLSISNNAFKNISLTTSGISSMIANSNATPNFTINNNQICGAGGLDTAGTFTKAAGSTVNGYVNATGGTSGTITNNKFSNITLSGATAFYGIRQYNTAAFTQVFTINNNTVSNVTNSGFTGDVIGIAVGGYTSGCTIYNNNINTISTAGTTAVGVKGIQIGYNPTLGSEVAGGTNAIMNCYGNTIYGLSMSGAYTAKGIDVAATAATLTTNTGQVINIYKNKIYNISSSNAASVSYGINISNAITTNIYNNIIGDITSTNYTSGTAPYIGVSGIYLAAGTTHNLYNNTVYFPSSSTSSGLNFSTNCVYANTTSTVLMQNNLLLNLSTPKGAGKAVAYQRATVTLTSYSTSSNNNSLFGTTALFTDGTNTYTLLNGAGSYKTAMLLNPTNTIRETAALNQNPLTAFISTTGSDSTYLHITAGTTTPLESGGMTQVVANSDFDGHARPGPAGSTFGGATAYDIGADEFDGVLATPQYSAQTVTPSNCASAIAHDVSVAVTSFNDMPANPVLTYYLNGSATGTNITMTGGSLTTGTSTWIAQIPVQAVGIPVTWKIVATDNLGLIGTYNGSPYRDGAGTFQTATASATVTTLCAGNSTTLSSVFASTLAEATYTAPAALISPTTDTDIGTVLLQNSGGGSTIFTNTSAANSLVGTIGNATGLGGSLAGGYSNFSTFGPSNGYAVNAGSSYSFTISTITAGASNNCSVALFIDYNKNGLFTDTGEAVYLPLTVVAGPHNEGASFTIPQWAAGGKTRMRVVCSENNGVQIASYASISNLYAGEYEDYSLNIAPYIATYSWNIGSTTGSQTGIATPAAATTTATVAAPPTNYYISGTDYYGCKVSNFVAIAASPTLNGGAGFSINTSSSSLCNGVTASLSTSSITGGCPTLTYEWTASPSSTVTFGTPNAATTTFSAVTPTTYTITCTIRENGATTGGGTVSTNTLPIVVSNPIAVPNPSTYSQCGTGTQTLTANTPTGGNTLAWYSVATGGSSLGTGTSYTTTFLNSTGSPYTYYVEESVGGPLTAATGSGSVTINGNAVTPFTGNWESQHTQYLITAADLTAAGFTSGNLTSVSINVSTKSSNHTTGYVGYTMKIGSAGSTSSLTGLLTPTFTTVYGPTTMNTVAGANLFNFSTPYNWNGTDNILLDVCYANDTTGSTTTPTSWSSNDTVTGTTKSGTVVFGYRADDISLCGTTGATSGSGSVLPNFTFTGQSVSCRGSRIPVTITVTAPPTLAITADQTICNNAVGTLTVTSTPSNFSSYIWSPTTGLFSDAACTINYTGTNLQTVYVKSTTASAITYTCTATQGACVNTATTTPTILPIPTISSSGGTTFCLSGSTTLSVSPSTGYGAGTIQWQISTTGAGGSYANVSTGTTLATGTITATRYYKAIIKDGLGATCSEALITINVNNPTVSTTTPANRCGTGTVTLGATGNVGATLNWYAASTGGTSLGTGTSFITPSIASTTTYYVDATNIGGTEAAGKPSSTGADGNTLFNNSGIVFNAIGAFTLNSAVIYPVGTGTVTVALQNSSGTELLSTAAINVTGTGVSTPVTIPLNFAVAIGTGYRLVIKTTTGITGLIRDFTNSFPYTTTNCSVTGGLLTGSASTNYYFLYNLDLTIGCASTRTAVTATITAPPVLTLSTSGTSICAGVASSPAVIASVVGGTSVYNTYTWSPATNVTGDITSGWTFNPSGTTVYTLTATQTGGSLCSTTATYTVTVNQSPSDILLNTTAISSCPGTITTLTASGGTYTNTIMSENFNGAVTGWTAVNNSTGGTPAMADWSYLSDGTSVNGDVIHSNDSTTFAVSNSDDQGTGGTTATILTSPNFSLVGYTTASLNFYHLYNFNGAGETANVQISTNGSTWSDLVSYTSDQGSATSFANVVLNLNAYVGNPTVAIRFKYDATFDWHWTIDNVSVTGTGGQIVWSPTTNLYIDVAATTTPYVPATHPNQLTLYAKPTITTTYTATSTVAATGCFKSASCVITTGSATYTSASGGSWSGGTTPGAGKNIVFDSGTYSSTGDLSGCSCTINPGAVVTINSNHTLTLTGAITNTGGSMTFENNSSLIQNTSGTSNPNTGNITYKRTTSTLVNNYDFVFWGSPVAGQTLGSMWMTTANDTFYSFNTMATTPPPAGTGGQDWAHTNPSTVMAAGKGYIARSVSGQGGWTPGNTFTSSFTGVPNNGEYTFNLRAQLSGGVPTTYTLNYDLTGTRTVANIANLMANPYPSAIDITAFQNDINNTGRTTGNYWFWSHTTPGGPTTNFYSSDDYAVLQGATGTGIATRPPISATGGGLTYFAPDQYIDAGQSFFVEYAAGGDNYPLKFKNSMRVAGNNNNFFRTTNQNASSSFEPSDRVWLDLRNNNGVFKQIAVVYTAKATNEHDTYYDAQSFDGNSFVDFYTSIPNYNFTIQSRPTFSDKDIVQIGYRSSFAGDLNISIDHSDGHFANGQKVYLQDNLLNIDHDLTTGAYHFKTEIGAFNERFVLKYNSYLTNPPADGILIANNRPNLSIRSLTEPIENVIIYDLLGRKVYEKDSVKNYNFTENNMNLASQTLIVKITLKGGEIITKKIVFN